MFPSVVSCSSDSTQKVRVLIAERDRMAGQLLAESLERDSRYQVVALPPVAQLFSVAALRKPDVAVISADFVAGSRQGLQVARTLTVRLPNTRIVILLDMLARESVLCSFRSGARGVFCRTEPVSEFRDCIEQVSRGEIWARNVAAEYLLEALRSSPCCDAIEEKGRSLSKRELEVIECAVHCQTNKQIAHQLRLSEHTVKNYLFRIFEKLGVSSRMELLLLLSSHNKDPFSTPADLSKEGLTGSLQEYLKAARQGWLSPQFIVGLAYFEGLGAAKDERSAYYWLRMAEENSTELRKQICSIIQEVKARMAPRDVEELEKSVMAQKGNMLVTKKMSDFVGDVPNRSATSLKPESAFVHC